MPEWIACPSCNLRHSRRKDGICPKCGQSTEAGEAPPPPPSADLASPPTPAASLPSLAQSARSDALKNARGTLFAVGILTVLFNGFMFMNATNEVNQAFEAEVKKLGPDVVIDQDKLAELKAEALGSVRLIYGGAVLLGLVFCACGALVSRHPVPVTVTSLVLYLGATAVFGFMDPESLLRGVVMKVIVVGALFKAVQAALAYQKEAAEDSQLAA